MLKDDVDQCCPDFVELYRGRSASVPRSFDRRGTTAMVCHYPAVPGLHAMVKHTDNVNRPRPDSGTGGYFPQERTVRGVVRLVQIDEAHVCWDSTSSPRLLQSAC